ncbi:hypothetical protein [Actinomadura yumaensis]|uniref:DUF222 domain-containing protein n=1 Tax=Actinomadura yumaensis TaxID=111807 RepID=A0ABW2CNQ8_9ACTN
MKVFGIEHPDLLRFLEDNMRDSARPAGLWLTPDQLDIVSAALGIAAEDCASERPDGCGCPAYGDLDRALNTGLVTLPPAPQSEEQCEELALARARALLGVYRALPDAARDDAELATVVTDMVSDLLHLAQRAGTHPAEAAARAVRNAFEERPANPWGSVNVADYHSVKVASVDGRPVPRRRTARLAVTAMRHFEISTPVGRTVLADGTGDDIGDYDYLEALDGDVFDAADQVWRAATGDDL